jgi:hypothetical protein
MHLPLTVRVTLADDATTSGDREGVADRLGELLPRGTLGGGGTWGCVGASAHVMSGTATVACPHTAPPGTTPYRPAPGFTSSGCRVLMELSATSWAALHVGLLDWQPVLDPRPRSMVEGPFQMTLPWMRRSLSV